MNRTKRIGSYVYILNKKKKVYTCIFVFIRYLLYLTIPRHLQHTNIFILYITQVVWHWLWNVLLLLYQLRTEAYGDIHLCTLKKTSNAPFIYCVLFNHKNIPPSRKRHHNLWRHHAITKLPRHNYVGGKTFLQWIWCNYRIFNIKSNIEQTILKCFCFKVLACVCVITASKRYTAC